MDDLTLDSGMPSDLQNAYGKIMDNYYFSLSHTENHEKTIEDLSLMFGYKKRVLSDFTLKNRYDFIKSNYPAWLHLVENKINQKWNGYCPESLLKGKDVRMRLNQNDFYESEETGLQIAVLSGVQAIIMNFRGEGKFRTEPKFADEIENGELLSPQNTDRPPFNNPTEVFKNSEEIQNYINQLPQIKDFDNPFISDNSITEMLFRKIEIEKKLETYFKENGFDHFSSKKFVGDLGEYYAKINLEHLFKSGTLKISKISNSSNDISGKLKSEVAKEWNIDPNVRIEVKTRFNQKGNPHLFGINKENFDLLVFVSLNDDYSVHFIGVAKKEDLPETDKQYRIVFSNKIKLVYPKHTKFEKHQ